MNEEIKFIEPVLSKDEYSAKLHQKVERQGGVIIDNEGNVTNYTRDARLDSN